MVKYVMNIERIDEHGKELAETAKRNVGKRRPMPLAK